jgi:hypothetical protein
MKFLTWLFGCSHHRMTFPITLTRRPKRGMYVVCLDCGKEFGYDWNKMKRVEAVPQQIVRYTPIKIKDL